MKVAELSEYKETTEKTGVKVWDRVIHRATHVERRATYVEFIIIYASATFAAINTLTGAISRWGPVKIDRSAMNRNFTKSELEQILDDLDDWEVVE